MAISSASITVTTTPTLIYLGDGATTTYLHSSSGTCYLGASDVTSSTGYQMDNGDKIAIDTHETSLYSITSTGTTTLKVLVVSK
jgi:hypothetical protein